MNPRIEGIGLAPDRIPQRFSARLPAGTTVVSADSCYQFGFDGKSVVPEAAREFISSHESRPGSYDLVARLEDMDVEGISKDIAFPQLISFMHYYSNFEIRELAFRVYNEHMAELQQRAMGRLNPSASFRTNWNAERADGLMQEFVGLGLKRFGYRSSPARTNRACWSVMWRPKWTRCL